MVSRANPVREEKIDSLRVRVYGDRLAMGAATGAEVAAKIKALSDRNDRPVRMIFAAAPSQEEVLATLAADEEIDWSGIEVFHMDEYVGLSEEAPQSFGRFLRERLFDAVKPAEVHLLDGMANVEAECERYTALLREAPIDIVCLGIGENAHIAFNDPPVADFEDPRLVKPVELGTMSRQQQVNDGMFPSLDAVPTHALTLTVPALISGTHLFCAVPGATKHVALECTLRGEVSTECPASILRRHSDCGLYADEAAYSG